MRVMFRALVQQSARFCVRVCTRVLVYGYVRSDAGQTGEGGGSCPDREMRIVSVYELSGVGEQIAQSN